jgi:hypothetical protein
VTKVTVAPEYLDWVQIGPSGEFVGGLTKARWGAVGVAYKEIYQPHGTVCREVLYPLHPSFGRAALIHVAVDKPDEVRPR